jgi:hypothetical protein
VLLTSECNAPEEDGDSGLQQNILLSAVDTCKESSPEESILFELD